MDTFEIIGLLAYFVFAYFLTAFISRRTIHLNKYFRLLILSFLYALFFGIGFAGSGGEPGFALPAPNLIAIILMINIGFYQGVISGLVILLFWWTIIFLFIFVRNLLSKRGHEQQVTDN